MTKASIQTNHYRVALQSRQHQYFADEPKDVDGTDTAASPDELLEAALASCTIITLRMYADRKQWPVTNIQATVQAERKEITTFTRSITIEGNITDEQKERLLQVAKACPVSKTLSAASLIHSTIQ
jgi:putative redox protein